MRCAIQLWRWLKCVTQSQGLIGETESPTPLIYLLLLHKGSSSAVVVQAYRQLHSYIVSRYAGWELSS